MKRGYKLLFTLTLSLALLLGMTAIASAANATAVYINGTALDASTPYYQGGAALATVTNLDNTASFKDGVLTLRNVALGPSGYSTIRVDGDLTIKLIGENTITAGTDLAGITASADGDSDSVLTITGDGKLTIRGGLRGIDGNGNVSVVIDGSEVTAEDNTEQGLVTNGAVTISNGSKVTFEGDEIGVLATNVTISDSEVTVKGDEDGIRSAGAVTIDHSTVTAEGNEEGIYSAGAVTITDSEVNVNGGMDGIVSLQTITISNSIVTADGTTNRGMNSAADIIIENSSTVTASGKAQGIHSTLPITIDHSTVTANSTTGTGLLSSGEVTITDSAVAANGDLEGICSHGGAITISNSTVAAKGTRQHGILSSLGVIITDSTVTAEGIVGVSADTLTIGDKCTVNITANDAAIHTNSLLDFPHGNWYQWTVGDKTKQSSPSKTLSKSEAREAKTLTIEPIDISDEFTVTLCNGQQIWYRLGADRGESLGFLRGMPVPEDPSGEQVFSHWETASGVKIDFSTVVEDNIEAFAKWKEKPVYSFGGVYDPTEDEPTITSPDTFDSGIATSMVLTLLTATGAAWLGKKKD